MTKKNLTVVTKATPTSASTTSTLIEIFKKEVDKVIVGRVEPRIYAFYTNCVPNALKVGDTYRPVSVRLDEWKKHYKDLEEVHRASAFANPDKNSNDFTYFRDYAVHIFLENNGKNRLQDNEFPKDVKYHSNEFFKNATKEDVENAIEDIQDDYRNKTRKYPFYEEGLPKKEDIPREEKYEPREIQKKAICNFSKALKNGRSNLLMYAVMRFGKTFTAMCCAEEMGAKVVVIVSAKKDVKESWKEIVKGHTKFEGYEFFDADVLTGTPNAITEYLKEDINKNKAAVFLTLQDLSGEGPEGKAFKEKHKALFDGSITIDLLIVDETHFGARAEQYGKVLQDPKYIKDTKKGDKLDEEDFVETSEGDKIVKAFDAKVKLHLSGTPYRILMGSEFEEEDIVVFFQYSDIVDEKKKWDKKHMDEDEWQNDYYGFPEMVRFAFNPNKSAREKLEELRKDGYKYALSALLKPKSIDKDDPKNDYQKFENEKEVLDLLKVIDGKESDDQLFSFLNYPKLQEGKMCRHIVMVLPYKASCDAMQKLINDHKSEFKNLKDYNIINISGVNVNSSKDVQCSTIAPSVKYKSIRGNLVRSVRNFITDCEKEGQKTLTLTVNRMLTGCTVPEWDTMLYMKDTSSPQEYDQAIFRLQNPYIKTYCVKDENGKPVLDEDDNPIIIKKDMKPQTLLVDFDPMRLFLLQEHKAQIYNVNTQNIGNSKLEVSITKELRISPLLTIDPDGNIVKVTAANILEKVSQYHYDRGIREEVDEIPIDMGLYDNAVFRDAIAKENEIGSKAGLSIPAHEGDGTDTKIETKDDKTEENKNENVYDSQTTNKPQEEIIWEKKLKSYFVKILLYAYLTDDEVKSLQDISEGLDSNDNRRIAKHLGLEKSMLQILLLSNIKRLGHYDMISRLDYKIQRINKLSHNTKLTVEKQVEVALCKFGKLGDAMVITPANIANDMVALFPEAVLKTKNVHLLDIATTSGEFAMALYRRMKDLGIKDDIIKKSIYSIPKSSICYELTRKVYKLLGLNIDNIAEKFNAFDLLEVKKGKSEVDYDRMKKLLGQKKSFKDIKLDDRPNEKDNNMIEFHAIVGNPPYNATKINTSDNPIYHLFMDLSFNLAQKVSLITPAKYLSNVGKTPKKWNNKILNDEHFKVVRHEQNSRDVFPEVSFPGGVAIMYWDKNEVFGKVGFFSTSSELSQICAKVGTANEDFISIKGSIFLQNKFNIGQLLSAYPGVKLGSNGKERRLTTSIFELKDIFTNKRKNKKDVKILGLNDNKREYRWIDSSLIEHHQNLMKWKVLIPKSNGSGAIGEVESTQIIGEPIIGEPSVGFTQSFISIGAFETEEEATAALKYVKTKFARFMLGTKKTTQDNNKDTWGNVPLQDFTSKSKIPWTKSVSDIDKYLYKKYKLSKDEISFIENKIKPMV